MKLSDRMKTYEQLTAGQSLIPNMPIMIRIDGKSFHSWTRGMNRPYDDRLQEVFDQTTACLVEATNAVIGYTQSDEITLIIWNFGKIGSDTFFSGNIAKLNSVLASMATAYFNKYSSTGWPDKDLAFFDCRAWNVPNPEEAVNCLIWREQDAVRNSVQMAAQSVYSHKQLFGKNNSEMQEMLFQKGINWNDYPARFKRGGYFRRELYQRPFTAEELLHLPERHDARRNPDLLITRSRIASVDLPILTKITNRIEVVFYAAEPLLNNNEVAQAAIKEADGE